MSTVPACLCAVATAASAIWLCACARGPEHAAVARRDSAGVEIVTSPAEDRGLGWRAVPLATLDGSESGTPFGGLARVGIAADAAGYLYVLDQTNHRVVVYDSLGTFISALGGEGRGPGEFEWPTYLAVADDGTIHVADYGKSAFVRIGPQGEPLPPVRWTRPLWSGLGVSPAGMRFVAYSASGDGHELLLANPADTAVLGARAQPETGEVHLESCGFEFINIDPVLAPEIVWAARGPRTAVSDVAAYAIDLYHGDTLRRTLRRDLPPREVTEEMAFADLGEGMRVGSSTGTRVCDPEEVVEELGYAPELQWVGAMAMAPDGMLWVERGHVKGQPAPTDMFDSTGAYMGTLPPEFPFPAAFVSGARIAVLETDELGVERVAVYRIERDSAGQG